MTKRTLLAELFLGIATSRAAVLGQGFVRDIAFAPDGERVAVARTTHVEIWDSNLHRLMATIPQAGGGLAWSPDGAKLAIHGSWTTLWDVAKLSKLGEWPSHSGAESLSWSPAADRIIEATSGAAVVYGADGKLQRSRPKPRLFQVAWSGIGNRVAMLVDAGAEIWDPDSDKLIRTIAFPGAVTEVFEKRFANLAWSPREPLLATCNRMNTVQIWNGETGELLATMQGGGNMHSSLIWSRDGAQVALATDQSLIVWEARSGKLIREIHPALRVGLATFSPQLDRAIVSSVAGEFELWDLRSSTSQRVSAGNAETEYLAWSPQDLLLAAWGSSGIVQIWDHAKGVVRSQFHAAIWGDRSVVWSVDGRWIAAAADDGSISLHNALAGKTTLTLRGARAPVYAISLSPDGARLAAVAGGSLFVWELSKSRAPLQFPIPGMQLAWSSAGTILVGTIDNSLVEIDVATGKRVWSPKLETPAGYQASPVWIAADGKSFIAGPQRTLWLRENLGEPREAGGIAGPREVSFSSPTGGGFVDWAEQLGFPGTLHTCDLRSGQTSWMNLPSVAGPKSFAVSTDRRALAVGVGGVILFVSGPGGK
jgi:WD40 repeat protein